jgi:hypothetical protein
MRTIIEDAISTIHHLVIPYTCIMFTTWHSTHLSDDEARPDMENAGEALREEGVGGAPPALAPLLAPDVTDAPSRFSCRYRGRQAKPQTQTPVR